MASISLTNNTLATKSLKIQSHLHKVPKLLEFSLENTHQGEIIAQVELIVNPTELSLLDVDYRLCVRDDVEISRRVPTHHLIP